MSDTITLPTPTPIYAFSRATRHDLGVPIHEEAVTVRQPATIRLAARTYRDLRRAGIEKYDARIRIWLLLSAPADHITVQRVDL